MRGDMTVDQKLGNTHSHLFTRSGSSSVNLLCEERQGKQRDRYFVMKRACLDKLAQALRLWSLALPVLSPRHDTSISRAASYGAPSYARSELPSTYLGHF